MSEKKRKSKRPKAIQAKRVTTEASKAKLPAPTRKRKATPRETWAEGYAKWEAKAGRIPRVRCPRCEKLVPAHPNDIHTCYDAKALREELATPSPIAGQPLPKTPTADAPDFRAIPCGEDAFNEYVRQRNILDAPWVRGSVKLEEHNDWIHAPFPPPDTSAYPWGLKFAWWLDGVPTRVRRWLSAHLRALAGKVAP